MPEVLPDTPAPPVAGGASQDATQEALAATDELDRRVETLLQQMEEAARRATGLAAEAGAPGEPVADLTSRVDQLLAAAAHAPPPEELPSIGTLDDELAAIASGLEGEVCSEPAPPPAPVGAPEPDAPAALAAPDPALDPSIADPPMVKRCAEPAPPTPSAGPPWWKPALEAACRALRAGAGIIRRYAPMALARIEPVAFRAAAAVSAPLRNRPALIRDAVGWVAMLTAFYASVVFVYFLFIHEPEKPAAHSAPVGLNDPAHPPAAAAPPHKEAKKSGADHGAGSTKPAARKSALKRPEKKSPAPKQDSAPAPKPGGH